MAKHEKKVSVTIKCPLGAQKRKENKIHTKPERESPKYSSTNQTKFIKDKYAKMPWLKANLKLRKAKPVPKYGAQADRRIRERKTTPSRKKEF